MRNPLRFWILTLLLGLTSGCATRNVPISLPQSTSPVNGTSAAQAYTPQPVSTVNATNATEALSNPTQGLDKLPAYRASLRYSFDGTQTGKPSQWSQAYTLTVIKNPQTRLMTYAETGLDPSAPAYPALDGMLGDVLYMKNTAADTCVASYTDPTYDPSTLVEPAGLLPKLKSMHSAGAAETVGGVQATPFTFDASAVTDAKSAQASGKVWFAADGNTIVKFSLELKGGNDVFDADTSGTLAWDYQLEPLDPVSATILPADCPLPLPDVPSMADASNVQKYPGYLSYETTSSIQDVADFYIKSLPGAGFIQVGDGLIGTVDASLAFSKNNQVVGILIEGSQPTQVTVTGQTQPSSSASQSVTPTASAAPANPLTRVANSLNLLTGQGTTASVFPSYHMEYTHRFPKWVNDKLVQSAEQLSADVQGQNVHFTDVVSKTKSEVYLIDGQEYEVKNGKVVNGSGMAGLAWTMWPLDPAMVIAAGSLKSASAGVETLDGRPVEVYEISGSTADDPTGMLAGMGFAVTKTNGKIWVDQATGGLLKAVIDYEADVKDTSGAVKSNGSGRLEILVTQVGAVTVALPK